MPTSQTSATDEPRRRRLLLAGLESDLAYFQARLSLIADPGTTNQLAQRRVFTLLQEATSNTIVRTKREFIRSR